jgi:predicted esterase
MGKMSTRSLCLIAALCVATVAIPAGAQDDVADVSSQGLLVARTTQKQYFLIGSTKAARAPKKGFGLLVVMPGGPGTADFLPFVKGIWKNALPRGYLVAQLVAVHWQKDPKIVWPSAQRKVEGMKFTTEQFVDAVIDDVAGRHKIDRERVFTLSWSSSGPAAYAVSLTSKKVTGSLVAMSVFNPKHLPELEKAKGHGYYLYHSRDDRICPFRMAEQAEKDLKKAGAQVKLVEYEGKHGWHGPIHDDIRAGIKWLEKNHARPGN